MVAGLSQSEHRHGRIAGRAKMGQCGSSGRVQQYDVRRIPGRAVFLIIILEAGGVRREPRYSGCHRGSLQHPPPPIRNSRAAGYPGLRCQGAWRRGCLASTGLPRYCIWAGVLHVVAGCSSLPRRDQAGIRGSCLMPSSYHALAARFRDDKTRDRVC